MRSLGGLHATVSGNDLRDHTVSKTDMRARLLPHLDRVIDIDIPSLLAAYMTPVVEDSLQLSVSAALAPQTHSIVLTPDIDPQDFNIVLVS